MSNQSWFSHPRYFVCGFFGVVLIACFSGMELWFNLLPGESHFLWQVITGFLLAALLVYQWVLLYVRVFGGNVRRFYQAHRWVGVICTILFALHAFSFGYGWTNTLAIVFCLSAVTGLLNREIFSYRSVWMYKLWYWSHITLSINLIPLVAVHIWVALAYEGLS